MQEPASKARQFPQQAAHTISMRTGQVVSVLSCNLFLLPSRYSDLVKPAVPTSAVTRVVQSVITALAATVAQAIGTEGSQPTGKLVLPTLAILLEWWAASPAYST